jgi:hypothetical protein
MIYVLTLGSVFGTFNVRKSTVWQIPEFYMQIALTFWISFICCSRWQM